MRPRDPEADPEAGEHTWGTHNMGDDARATAFADVQGLTETAPWRQLRRQLPRRYAIRRAPGNRSLVLVYDRRKFRLLDLWVNEIHGGTAGVTPGRDTLGAILQDRATGETYRVLVGHRINNAHGRVKRARRALRERLWWRHFRRDRRAIRRGLRHQDHVVTLGDANRAHGEVYPGLEETDRGYDRIGWSSSLELVDDLDVLSRVGSDHNRKRVTLRPVSN